MTRKEKQADKVLKMITEGKQNLLVENPLLMGLLRMGLMNYLFGDVVKTQVNNLVQKFPDLSPSELLKKAGLNVTASDEDIEDFTKDDYLSNKEKERLGVTGSFLSSSNDDKFYTRVLKDLGAPVTDGNITFLKAIRQSEGAKARFNPFNTTMKKMGSSCYNVLKRDSFGGCKSGVQSYVSEEDGIDATVDTLKLGYYKDIVLGLKNDVGPKELAKRWAASPWGTGALVKRVVDSYLKGAKPSPPPIAR